MFSKSIPNLQFVWDSTSLGVLKECPRKYYYTIIQGYVSNGFAIHLAFGIAYHKALEIFEHAKASGADHDTAVREAVKFCVSFGEYKADRWIPYDRDFTNNPNKTTQTLTRSVIWYCDTFRNDPYETVILNDGKPALELSFKLPLTIKDPDGEPYLLAGHLDRLVIFDGDYWFLDRKTTGTTITNRYFSQFNPSNQMSLYDGASQFILNEPAKGGIIDAAQIAVGFTRFSRDFLIRSPNLREEWLFEIQYWINSAETFARNNYWPMNDKSCGNYGGCAFQEICSRDPSIRDKFLKHGNYKIHRWNPLDNRGDI